MSTNLDFDRIASAWLAEGPSELNDRVLDAALDEVHQTHQRRRVPVPWRFNPMPTPLRLAAAALVGVLALALIYINLPGRSDVGGPVPSPTTTASPGPSLTTTAPSPSPARIPDGPLAAGPYTFQPFAGPGGLCTPESLQAGCLEAGAEDDSIHVTYTLPDGWTGIEGWAVAPTVESYSPPGGASLLIMRGGWLYSEAFCTPIAAGHAGPTIPTGTTVDEFVTALVAHPDLDLTSPVDVVLAGYSGMYLELQAPANTTTTPDNPEPGECQTSFVWEPGIYAQGPSALWRIWVLDVDGVRVIVRSDSFPGTSSEVQAQLAAIVDSIQIEP